MTGKERAEFRAQANSLKPELQIGKDGMSDAVATQVLDCFRTKELLKIKVLLESAPESPRELADKISAATGSEVIQVIGGTIVLWKKNEDLGKEKKKKAAPKKTKPLANVKAKRAAAAKREEEMKREKRNFYAKKRFTSGDRDGRRTGDNRRKG